MAQNKRSALLAVALALDEGVALQPSPSCRVCGRRLDDDISRARGVGVYCWRKASFALKRLQAERKAQAAAEAA